VSLGAATTVQVQSQAKASHLDSHVRMHPTR